MTIKTLSPKLETWLRDDEINAMIRCVAVAAAVVAIGTLGFHLIQTDWTFWDSFYFTLVTISTVGYGDYDINDGSKKFAAFLLLCGIGTFTYSLSTLVRIASDVEAAARRKMRHDIAHTHDHVIVCGYGRMGRMLCDELTRDGLPCVVVERDEEMVERARVDGRLVVGGVASEEDVLLQAGIDRAAGVVCAVDSDAENMFITVTASELNPGVRIISRAESPTSVHKLERAGASLVISPHQMAGKTIATALIHPRLAKFLNAGEAGGLHFELGEVEIEAGSNADGKTVRQLGADLEGLVFVAIDRSAGGLIVQPRGDLRFESGDVVIFAGSGDVVHHIRAAAAPTAKREPAIV